MPSLKDLWTRLTARKPTETALIHQLVGLGIGILMIAAVVFLKVTPGLPETFYHTLDLKFLDWRFKARPKIEEHTRIVHIDLDDASLQNLNLPYPLPRSEWARIIGTLHTLGARTVIMDVTFPESAESTLNEKAQPRELKRHDDNLATAIAEARNVFLAYDFKYEALPSEGAAPLYDRMRPVVLRNIAADEASVARELGVAPEAFLGKYQLILRRILLNHLVDTIRERHPEAGLLPLDETLAALIPGYSPDLHATERNLVQLMLDRAYAVTAIERHSSWVCTDEAAVPDTPILEISPPVREFVAGSTRGAARLAGARGAGFVTSFNDKEDGILRHCLPLNVRNGRAYYHLAFRAVCHALGATPDRITINPRQSIEIRPDTASFPTLPERIVAPLNRKGQILINWAGTGVVSEPPFVHIPIGAILEADRRTLMIGDNAADIFTQVKEGVVDVIGDDVPAPLRAMPDSLRTLLDAEAESARHPDVDVYAAMARRRTLRTHADWMVERIAAWKAFVHQWVPAAVRAGVIAPADAQGIVATFDAAETTIRDHVTSNVNREKFIHADIGSKIRESHCIVGAFGTSVDLHPTPLYAIFAGPGLLSNLLNMFFTNQFLYGAPTSVNLAVIIGLGLTVSFLVTRAGPVTSTVSTLVALVGWLAFAQYLFIRHSLIIDVFGPALVIFLPYAFITAYRQLIEGRDKRQVRKMFGLFVSDDVLSELMKNPKELSLGGQKRITTIFFSDVSGFTALSEKMDPADQIRFMNEYLTSMSEVIMRNKGYVDKYIGDGIMAVYGAPLPSDTHAVDAARTALGCIEALKTLNEKLTAENKPNIKIRIGLSTGEVVAGLVGSLKKLQYTAMGDTVNLGARLEAASKPYKTKILMNDTCYGRCKEAVIARELDLIRVPGKSIPVQVFELLGLQGDGKLTSDGFLPLYNAGIALYKQRKWEDAARCFEQCLALNAEDGPSKIYHERCTLFMDVPPGDDWDGVATVSVK